MGYSRKRRRTRRWSTPNAGPVSAVARVLREAVANTRTQTTTRPTESATALTAQQDYKTDYRKRRLSRKRRRAYRRKRKWKRKIVNTVRNADVGSTHVVRRAICQLTTTTNQSNAVSFGLYGLNGTSGDAFNPTADIREIFREISDTDWTNATNGVASQQHKIYSMHGTMEMTVRNVNSTNDALVEAYFIRGKKRSPVNYSPTSIYSTGFAKAALASDPNTGNLFDSKLSFSDVGITPFQSPWFTQHFTIYKRQKFTLAPGGECSFILHDRKARTFKMDYAATCSTDKNFHGVLFQQYGLPVVAGAESYALPTDCVYSSIRRYRIKMFRDNLPKTALDPSGV